MQNNKKIGLISLLILISGLIVCNLFSNSKKPMRKRPVLKKTQSVKLTQARNISIKDTTTAAGRLYAYHKIQIFAEVSGVLFASSKPFKEGTKFRKGEILLQLDNRVYRNSLLSQRSQFLNLLTLMLPDLSIDFPENFEKWEEYLKEFDIKKSLKPLPSIENTQERFYIASKNIYSLYYSIKGMETTLKKYQIKAPFTGTVTESNINPGELARPNQKLGEYIGTELYEIRAAIGISESRRVRIGQPVVLTTDEAAGRFYGKIVRINPKIDQNSMTARIFIQTSDQGLKDGMYMKARIALKAYENVSLIPPQLINNNQQVFIVRDSVLYLKKITVIGEYEGKMIIRGLENGATILAKPWEQAAEGVRLPSLGQSEEISGQKQGMNQ